MPQYRKRMTEQLAARCNYRESLRVSNYTLVAPSDESEMSSPHSFSDQVRRRHIISEASEIGAATTAALWHLNVFQSERERHQRATARVKIGAQAARPKGARRGNISLREQR
jgi:hypothetical protein